MSLQAALRHVSLCVGVKGRELLEGFERARTLQSLMAVMVVMYEYLLKSSLFLLSLYIYNQSVLILLS